MLICPPVLRGRTVWNYLKLKIVGAAKVWVYMYMQKFTKVISKLLKWIQVLMPVMPQDYLKMAKAWKQIGIVVKTHKSHANWPMDQYQSMPLKGKLVTLFLAQTNISCHRRITCSFPQTGNLLSVWHFIMHASRVEWHSTYQKFWEAHTLRKKML